MDTTDQHVDHLRSVTNKLTTGYQLSQRGGWGWSYKEQQQQQQQQQGNLMKILIAKN